ncbi:RHTO0S02e13256g1_1 [Rhodotorula toruloides]|uniref:RHTO0S02e13256g1_1 n=1 Tax=Rhodotorula toruloides TaxID=5286 RepID=A0A061AIB5_RHOTO|nr:RHTO0S02e13256g1_1 [Rhodotorula toruloides]
MGIPLDRFKFSWEVQDFVKCAGCRQVAYEPYFICPNEHVKCAACIQPPAAPIVGAVAAPPPAGPVAANCGVCSRALLAQPRPSPLLKRTIEAYRTRAVRGRVASRRTPSMALCAPSARHLARTAAGRSSTRSSRLTTTPVPRRRSSARRAAKSAAAGPRTASESVA